MISDSRPASSSFARGRLPCWCGSGLWHAVIESKPAGLIRCDDCGTYRTDPPPLTSDDESSEFYSDYYEGHVPGKSSQAHSSDTLLDCRSRFWKVAQRYQPLMDTGTSALDVGCGGGRLCAELAQHGWKKVCGVDISKSRIARARFRFPTGTFFDQPLEELNLSPGSFQLIVMDNVIEHLSAPLKYMQLLNRLLHSDGRIVLITPNLESGHFRLLGRWWTPELAPSVHIYLFTPASLTTLMRQAGFRVETVGSFNFEFKSPKFSISKTWIWRWMQELGTLYSHVLRAGPMLYVVAKRDRGAASRA
jgi:2-polyprenyl-3-methyl-5-hydroxy-6-metoxy-1,4-benzoquinol methylase